jgi:hypothetical protein
LALVFCGVSVDYNNTLKQCGLARLYFIQVSPQTLIPQFYFKQMLARFFKSLLFGLLASLPLL